MTTSRDKLQDIFDFCKNLCRFSACTEQEVIDEFNKQLLLWQDENKEVKEDGVL